MAEVVPNDTQEPMVNGNTTQPTPPPQEELTEAEILEKESQRPANIKADMKDMERNRRVSLILNSQAFREELEAIVESQLKTGPHPASLLALQQITDLILPHSRFNQSSGSRAGAGSYSHHVIPVADIRGVDAHNYTKGEKLQRCKLASLYRLLDLHGWTQLIYNHISVRVSHDQNHFLINPFGLMYHEISASSLIKIDNVGNIIDPGTTTYGPNLAGFTIHSAIHAARPDIKCVIHVHTPTAAAVSSMKCGLLPISQESLLVGDVSYLDYTGIMVEEEDKDKIIRSLGPNNKVMFMRNHGVLCCGATIEEAYFNLFTVMAACEIQVKSMAVGVDNLVLLPDELRKKTHEFALKGNDSEGKKWKIGELEFEAMMRQLDNMGYKTGYIYHQPVVQHEPKPRSEVAHPPISTNFTYVYDDDIDGSKYISPLKLANKRQQKEKTKWLNTPNQYTKMEVTIQEDGDSSPKTKTKWITSEDGTGGDSIVIQDPQQFAKQGDNPKEFKNKRRELKNDFYDDKKTAGPISEVLSGVTWQKPPQFSSDAPLSNSSDRLEDDRKQGNPTSDNVKAASKGIIQRDYQQEAVLYTSYTPNPFDKMTEKDILEYKKEIAEKTGQDVKEIELIVQDVPADDSTVVNNVSRIEGPEDQEVTVVCTSLKIETTIDGSRSEASSAAEDTGEKSHSDVEVSPSKENTSPSKKSKKKFRTPSFLKKKKEKKEKERAAADKAAGF
ncbi:gamma-adducin-like isoform X2 [Anneissia japonica]|uniref:gamma-adducin-like isoform X2 n=1 Tax=Anneissia japonica TaxID=1529436 RepID=UPI0014259F8C|nr:gamma-adducin-like isoform X2 [Anneissia japonica]